MPSEKIEPDTSFEFICKWFQKAEQNCIAQRRMESAMLWKDGLQHLEYWHDKATHPSGDRKALEALYNASMDWKEAHRKGTAQIAQDLARRALEKFNAGEVTGGYIE